MTEQERQLEALIQQMWLEFVAQTKPPLEIIEALQSTYKAGFQDGVSQAMQWRRKR